MIQKRIIFFSASFSPPGYGFILKIIKMARVSFAAAFALLVGVDGHGAMSQPKSRNAIDKDVRLIFIKLCY